MDRTDIQLADRVASLEKKLQDLEVILRTLIPKNDQAENDAWKITYSRCGSLKIYDEGSDVNRGNTIHGTSTRYFYIFHLYLRIVVLNCKTLLHISSE